MTEQALLTSALNSWKSTLERADRLFSQASEEQLQKEVAPGKNRLIYLWGHLTAVHDRMLPLLSLGERLHPESDAPFLTNPDRATPELPKTEEIKKSWRKSTADCWPGLRVFRQLNGCRSTPRFLMRTLQKIRHATALRFS